MGSVRVRTRTEVHEKWLSFRVYSGAVALVFELMLSFLAFPTTPPASCRVGKSVRVVRYGRALRAIKAFIVKSGPNHDEFALHMWGIFGATTLAAEREIPERVTQKRREVDVRRLQDVYAQ